MAEPNEKGLDPDKTEPEELEEPEEVLDEDGQDITDWKGLASKNFGRAKRYKTDFGNLKNDFEEYKKAHPEEAKKKEPDKTQDKKEFDLAEKSYLLASGISKEEIPLVWEEHQKSGKSIDEIMESPYFKEKLEKSRSENAIPSGGKQGAGAAKDQVEYWINQGKYPPDTPENQELRRKVAAALSKQAEDKGKFSSRPIV